MTEDIYGMLKRRFPIIKFMRTNLRNSINIILSTAVLHNIALEWQDPMPQDDHPALMHIPDPPQPAHADPVNVINALEPAERRQRAATMRDNYRAMMDPVATAREVRRMAMHRAEAEARRQARR